MANVINKITFDFTCASEEKARETQQEISNYVIPKMNEKLSYFFEKRFFENENIILKTVEIDLGDIFLGDFRENETLDKIREALETKLAKNYFMFEIV